MSIRLTYQHYCDFCGKSQAEVASIVAGPGVDICDECIALASKAVAEARDKQAAAQASVEGKAA